MDEVERLWEARSRKYGRSIEGVLTKSFPGIVNNYLDKWMLEQVSGIVDAKKTLQLLDLGCGYGRLSKALLKKFPNLTTVGVDISQTYVDLYNESLNPRGRAIKADILKLPFKKNSFDAIILVTTFLYIKNRNEQEETLKNFFRILKPGGQFAIIERNKPGYNYVTVGGLVGKIRGKVNREISTFTFDEAYLSALIKKAGGHIVKREGIPFCTLILPVLIVLGFIFPGVTKFLLKITGFFDRKFTSFIKPSVYVSYIGNV